jgi:hypothetical protein
MLNNKERKERNEMISFGLPGKDREKKKKRRQADTGKGVN